VRIENLKTMISISEETCSCGRGRIAKKWTKSHEKQMANTSINL